MSLPRTSRLLLSLALLGVGCWMAVALGPDGAHGGGLLPSGFASGALLLARRRELPSTTMAVLLLATLGLAAGGHPLPVSIGYAAALAVEAVVVRQVLAHDREGVAWLVSTRDFRRYLVACVLGAVLGGLGFGLVAQLADFGVAREVTVSTIAVHLTAQLTLVPLFLRLPTKVLPVDRRAMAFRWFVTLAVTIGAFIPAQLPNLVFLVIPALGWSAVRGTLRETQLMLLAVTVIAGTTTSFGLGPFQVLIEDRRLSPDLSRIPEQAFLISCALMTISFSLAVRSLRESERQAATVRSINASVVNAATSLLIAGTDEVGRLNLFSPGAERILGYRAEEVLGESPEMFHSQDEIERLARHFGCPPDFLHVVGALLEQHEGQSMDWEFVRKDGERRILSFSIHPLRDDDDKVVGFIAIGDDVTERVEATQVLSATLRTAVEAEREARRRLEEVDRAKDSFVSAVSHELRTPITSLLGYVEMLLDGSYGELTPEQHAALTRVSYNSSRLLGLIDDVLVLARVEDLGHSGSRTPTDLSTIVREVAQELRKVGELRALQVEVITPNDPVVVEGDRTQLRRLVFNLADNAAKFTAAGGSVELRLVRQSPGWALEVSDTGCGIPEEEHERLFERFFRTSRADRDAVPGTGMGLAIAQAIAEAHGATISLSSTVGIGSTFRVEFATAEQVVGGP